MASSRGLGGIAWLALTLAAAQGAAAQSLSPPEAVGHLLFSSATVAMSRTTTPDGETWRGSTFPEDPEHKVLSIIPSRASPCLFEVFFVEAPNAKAQGAGAVTTAYSSTIDLRRLDEAAFKGAPKPGGEARLTLRAKRFFCSRSMILEPGRNLIYDQNCLDEVDEDVATEHEPRMRAAFETLRAACRW